MPGLTSKGWIMGNESQGGFTEVNLHLDKVLNAMGAMGFFDTTQGNQKAQYFEALAKVPDLESRPLGEQKTALRYAPNPWEQVKQAFGWQAPEYATPLKKVKTELPPSPSWYDVSKKTEESGLPPTPPRLVEEERFFEPPPGVPKVKAADIKAQVEALKEANPELSDKEARQQAEATLGINPPPKTPEQESKDTFAGYTSMAKLLYPNSNEEDLQSAIQRLAGEKEKESPAVIKATNDAIKSFLDIGKKNKKLSTLEVAGQMDPNALRLIAPLIEKFATLLGAEQSRAGVEAGRGETKRFHEAEEEHWKKGAEEKVGEKVTKKEEKETEKKEKASEKEAANTEKKVNTYFTRLEKEFAQFRALKYDKGKGTLPSTLDFWNDPQWGLPHKVEWGKLTGVSTPTDHLPTREETVEVMGKVRGFKNAPPMKGPPPVPGQGMKVGALPTPPPPTRGMTLTPELAQGILREAGGDKDKARQIAKERGFVF